MGSPAQTGREAARRKAIGRAVSAEDESPSVPALRAEGGISEGRRNCGFSPRLRLPQCGGKVEVVNYQAMRRDLQSIREIIEQLQEEDRRAEEWWKATLARLEKQQRKLAPKKKPLPAKPKQRKRVGLG